MFGVHSDYCYIFLYFSLMSVFTASNASWWLYHISFGYSLHGIFFHFSWLHTSHGSWTRKSLLTFQSSDSYKLYTCILTHTHTHTHTYIYTHMHAHTHTHTHTPIALLLILSGIVDPNHLGITRNKAMNYFSWFHFLFPWLFLHIFYFFNIFYMYTCACSVVSDSLVLHDQVALAMEFSR